MEELPRGTGLIVAGGLNLDPEKASGQGRYEEIVVVVAMAGLEDLADTSSYDGGNSLRIGGRGRWQGRGG